MLRRTTKAIAPIYQLKITLHEVRPPIWRRVLVPGRFTLHQLHRVIQAAFGWLDCHLHQFAIDGQYYSIPSPDDWEPVIDERRHTLAAIAPAAKRRFQYEYDFGDSWKHDILVEKILLPEQAVKYPVCIAGQRACPPEDVGGTWGYARFLEAIADPEHEEHESYLEWAGGPFDPEEFNLAETNRSLQKVK